MDIATYRLKRPGVRFSESLKDIYVIMCILIGGLVTCVNDDIYTEGWGGG